MHGNILCIFDSRFHNSEYDPIFPMYVQWLVQPTHFHYATLKSCWKVKRQTTRGSTTGIFLAFAPWPVGAHDSQKAARLLIPNILNKQTYTTEQSDKQICYQWQAILQRSYQKHLFLPCTAKTLQGWVPWRDDSLFPPLMKAGRLGLLWSPTNFPGCCPIRAGCQAAAGTLQAGLSCSPSNSGPPGREGIGRRKRPLSLARSVLSWSMGVAGHLCKRVLLQFVSVYRALMEPECFKAHREAFQSNLEGKNIKKSFQLQYQKLFSNTLQSE